MPTHAPILTVMQRPVSNSTVLVIVRNAPGVWPLLSAESLLGADTPSKYLEITQL